MKVQVITDITSEPVTVAEAKLWCKVTGTAEDTIFPILITSARMAMEKYTACAFGAKKIFATWTTIPSDWLLIMPYGPIVSIDKVYRIDPAGNETTLVVNSDYWVTEDGNVQLSQHWSTVRSAGIWPTHYEPGNSYRVEYTAGYGATTTEPLPQPLKHAIMKQIATDYIFRENITDHGSTNLSNESKQLAAPFRRMIWF
jgi:uncharacterized phiE125 gp8 family phage protein